MKRRRLLLIPLCALPLIWLAYHRAALPENSRPPVHPAASTVQQTGAASSPVVVLPDTKARAAEPAPQSRAAVPLLRTPQELNQLADGSKPLEEKIGALVGVMTSGEPELARAAAVRAVFVVKNKDFRALLEPVILGNRIRPEAMEVLSLNMYDRPLDVRLPLWARIAETSGHPLESAAIDGLEFHLREKSSSRGPALAQAIKECLSGGRD